MNSLDLSRLEAFSTSPRLKLRVSLASWALSSVVAALCLSLGLQPAFVLVALLCVLPEIFAHFLLRLIPNSEPDEIEREIGRLFGSGAAPAYYRMVNFPKRRSKIRDLLSALSSILLYPVRGFVGFLLKRHITAEVLRLRRHSGSPQESKSVMRYLESHGLAYLLYLIATGTIDSGMKSYVRKEGEKILVVVELPDEVAQYVRELSDTPNASIGAGD